jgi:hypothetical protein
MATVAKNRKSGWNFNFFPLKLLGQLDSSFAKKNPLVIPYNIWFDHLNHYLLELFFITSVDCWYIFNLNIFDLFQVSYRSYLYTCIPDCVRHFKDNSWNLSFQFVSNGTDKSVRQIAGHFNSHLSTNIKVSLIYTYDAVGRSPLEYRGTAYYYSVSHLLNHYATNDRKYRRGNQKRTIQRKWQHI